MERNIQEKSFLFAVRVVKLCKYLRTEKQEYILCKQLMRAGTSIGANVTEAQDAQSRADFLHKLSIALKEAKETEYWLRLLKATDYLNDIEFDAIYPDCDELIKILVSSIKTIKK